MDYDLSAVDATDKIEPRFDRQVRTVVLQDLEAEAVAGTRGTVVYDREEPLKPRHGDFGGSGSSGGGGGGGGVEWGKCRGVAAMS